MQGTKDSKLLFRLSVSKRFLGFIVLLPALVATPVLGQESVLTLAMVSYDQSPARKAAVARNDSPANPSGYTSVPCLQYRIAGLKLNPKNTIGFSSDFLFEKQNGTGLRNWSHFIYKKSNANWQTGSWVHVEAGYGQFCQFESSLGVNAMEIQQPNCAYLKASFSF